MAMTVPASWDARAFADLLAMPGTFICTSTGDAGFAMGRVVLDEAELLTLAVIPAMQGKGLGRSTLGQFEAEAARLGARTVHLEVAASNQPARHLYLSAGWCETGRRLGYYRTEDGREDAVLMQRSLSDD